MADLEKLIQRSSAKQIRDKVTQRVLQTIHTIVDERIFKDGQDYRGNIIGRYSKGYIEQRKRGVIYPGKGKKPIKNTFPISPGNKVILQATSQMANDFKFLVLSKGNYGSGFSNDHNFDKSEWVESTYDTLIFRLTPGEEKELDKLLDKELEKFLNV